MEVSSYFEFCCPVVIDDTAQFPPEFQHALAHPRLEGGPGGADQSAALHTFGDAVADLLIDAAPVFEGTLQHGLRQLVAVIAF